MSSLTKPSTPYLASATGKQQITFFIAIYYRFILEQAYPNCPKYIQRREIKVAGMIGNISNSKMTGGTKRFWKFIVSQWIQLDSLSGIKGKFVNYSPFNV